MTAPRLAPAPSESAPPFSPGAAPAPAAATAAGVVRAVYGLVNDEYAVVGHTPNVPRDAARELCLTVGVGDPTVAVDDALSFLEVPGWGFVCTRYATEHDARGRLALVSDSVAVDAPTFRALRADPFRCFPRRQDRPASPGELTVPRFSASTPEAEMQRLAEARRTVDDARLRPILAALLAGDRVLHVAPDGPLAPVLLQTLVLLLPPSLRRHMTFQTIAAAAPRHAPRLTGADRRYAEFATVQWTRELPRQAAVADARADRAADALLALPPQALADAHAIYEELAGDAEDSPDGSRRAALLPEVERVARFGALLGAVATGAGADALRALADMPADDDGDAASDLATAAALALDALPPSEAAEALLALLAERRAESYRAGARLVSELLRWQRPGAAASRRAEAASETLAAVLAGIDRVRWAPDEPAARTLRAGLALVAAARGDAERLVQLAELDAPWSALPVDEILARAAHPGSNAVPPARTRATRAALASLARARAADAESMAAAIDALGALSPMLAAGRRDAAALALAVARRALAAQRAGAPDPIDRVASAIVAFWERVPPADPRDEALRHLLGGVESAPPERTRHAASAVRQLAHAGATPEEIAGWVGAATLRVLAAGGDAWPLVAALDAHPVDSLGAAVGALLLVAAPGGLPLRAGWPDLLERVDAPSRRDLLVRTLTAVAGGQVAVGDLAVAAASLAELGFELDAGAVDALAPAIARWAATLPATRGGTVKLEIVLGLLGGLADADAAAALAERVLAGAPPPLRDAVQLRRLAAAARAVDDTRDPDALARHRAALRARMGDRALLLPGQLARLRDFLNVGEPGRARRTLASLRALGGGRVASAKEEAP